MKVQISILIINLLEIAYGQYHDIVHYGRRSMQGSLIPLQGPIYMPAESILAAATMILGQQQNSMVGFLDEIKPSTTQNILQQIMYDEAYDTVNHRPVQVSRRSNTNTQKGIQQIGYGNMNLQGNIQQITNRRRPEEQNGRRFNRWYDTWDNLRGQNIKNLDVYQVYNIVEDETEYDDEITGVDIGSDFNVENVNLYQDVNVLSDDSF
ncbi:hypothetical protein PVAND_009703 [Polypedilum vanderplanki]|uniref:Uncharacterized protein n=1 Tax=Polypedilum vanderplanki TaxID=319348 RepID=A0A9J6CDN4_POLVA|nr:hypothetical protein PVAND_009703 [Polypedilum vanderplanki]